MALTYFNCQSFKRVLARIPIHLRVTMYLRSIFTPQPLLGHTTCTWLYFFFYKNTAMYCARWQSYFNHHIITVAVSAWTFDGHLSYFIICGRLGTMNMITYVFCLCAVVVPVFRYYVTLIRAWGKTLSCDLTTKTETGVVVNSYRHNYV